MHLSLLGLFVAFFSSGLGVGGGALLVPALMNFYKFDFRKAASTSLATIIPITCVGAVSHHLFKSSSPPILYYGLFIPLCLLGAILGGLFIKKLNSRWLRFLFGIFLSIVSIKMFQWINLPLLFLQKAQTILPHAEYGLLMAFGLATGFTSVMLGVGCGLMIVPFFVIILNLSIHEAITLSLTTMFFLTLTGTWIHQKLHLVNGRIIKKMLLPAFLGAVAGALFSNYLPEKILKLLFASFLFLMGIKYIIEEILTLYRKVRQKKYSECLE